MKKIEKILFPIDFAENFEALFPWVSTFVNRFEATLYVLFVAQDLADDGESLEVMTNVKLPTHAHAAVQLYGLLSDQFTGRADLVLD